MTERSVSLAGVSLLISLLAACASSGSEPAATPPAGQEGETADRGSPETSAEDAAESEDPGSGESSAGGGSGDAGRRDGGGAADSGGAGSDAGRRDGGGAADSGDAGAEPPLGSSVTVHLIPAQGVSGTQRVNLGLPLQPGQLMTEEYNEHFGESAYLIAMAWFYSGKTDASLRSAADALVARLGSDGEVPHVRSFNWQCRSAVAGPWFLR